MRRSSRFLALLAALALLTRACTGCAFSEGSASAASRLLKVGVRADVMGFGYLNPTTGKYYGLEIDLANELAQRMGYGGAEFTTVTPLDREEKLSSGEVELILACYTISDERREMVDFTPAYYDDSTYIIVQNSTLFDDPSQLKGLTVGFVVGTNVDQQFREKMKEIELLQEEPVEPDFIYRFSNDYEELSRSLESGVCDAVCMDGSIAKAYMNDERRFFKVTLGEMHYGAATAKGSELSAPTAQAMQQMLDDGTVARLIDKWD